MALGLEQAWRIENVKEISEAREWSREVGSGQIMQGLRGHRKEVGFIQSAVGHQ